MMRWKESSSHSVHIGGHIIAMKFALIHEHSSSVLFKFQKIAAAMFKPGVHYISNEPSCTAIDLLIHYKILPCSCI